MPRHNRLNTFDGRTDYDAAELKRLDRLANGYREDYGDDQPEVEPIPQRAFPLRCKHYDAGTFNTECGYCLAVEARTLNYLLKERNAKDFG